MGERLEVKNGNWYLIDSTALWGFHGPVAKEIENGRTTGVDQGATHNEGGAEDVQDREDDYGTEVGGDS